MGLLMGLLGAGTALLSLTAMVGALFWRVARLEKDLEDKTRKDESRDAKASATAQEVAVVTASLGRIEKGVEGIEQHLRTLFLPNTGRQAG